jgi:hypothetical protein
MRRLSGYKPFCCLAFGSAAEHQSPLAGGGVGIYFHPSFALHPCKQTDPLSRVDRSTLFIYFIVPTYLPTLELVYMNQDPLPYPPQMRNGGSPPTHLSLSSLSNPFAWLQYKWSQPPPRAPNCVPDAPDDWIGCALHEDQQAAGLLLPKPPGGPILHGAGASGERTYQDWKWTVNALWKKEHHHLQTTARQCHLNEKAACKKQEAAYRQPLLDKRASNKCQKAARKEAACCQRLLDEKAACCLMAKHAALARQMAAARTIFLWLRRRHLHVRLARQTSWQQQCKATLARL